MGRRFDTVSFLSDYGLDDEFAGVVKAVIRAIAPHVTVIDLTHRIPPHDRRAGGLALARSVQYLPTGVILAVVDPGVGTDRRAIAVEVGSDPASGNGEMPIPAEVDGEETRETAPHGFLVGPDNGLLAPAVAMAGGARRAVSLTNTDYHLEAPGPTFAGRDVLGPVAGHLCSGVDLEDLGELIDPLSLVPAMVPLPQAEGGRIIGEVLWVDRFGNAQLNIDPDDIDPLGDRVLVKAGERSRPAARVTAYGDLAPGQLGLVVDSYGLLSVVLDQRSAAEEMRLVAGDTVTLELAD